MKVSIVIPTVKGREASFDRCVHSYKTTLPAGWDAEFIIVRDRPSCGEAWNEGAAIATGGWLHITADDIEAKAGWLDAAVHCRNGFTIPSPILELPRGGTDGEIGADGELARMTPLPFIVTDDWPGCPPIHYWSDYAVSRRLELDGHEIRWCHGYRFIHHRVHDEARGRMERRFHEDREIFLADQASYEPRVAVCAS